MTSCTRWEHDIPQTPPTGPRSVKKGGDPDYLALKNALFKLWQKLAPGTEAKFAQVAADVEKHFAVALKKVAAPDIAFVLEKRSDRAIAKLRKSAPVWARTLPDQVQLLVQMLREIMAGKYETNWQAMAAITATVKYLMNPLDLLVDFKPEVGLMDDVLMVGLCVSTIRRDLVRYSKERAITLKEYGL